MIRYFAQKGENLYMTELPKGRTNSTQQIIKKDYSYTEIIKNNINIEQVNAIIISELDLTNNMEKLLYFLNLSPNIQLKFKNFESTIFIDDILKNHINNKSFLLDDSMLIDRSYIDLTQLKNISLIIPLNYLMWGVKFNEQIDIYCFLIPNQQGGYLKPTSLNGNKTLSYKNYIKVRKKIKELARISCKNSKDKVFLISDYIQSCTQYVAGYQSESSNGVFITPAFLPYDRYKEYSGLIETVLNCNNGLCIGIANLSTLLLNNDIMNVETESVYGCRHAWNKVLIDGKYYYFDNTWSITRNENISEEGLIALSFSRKHLLFGNQTAMSIGHHNPKSIFIYDGAICEDDIVNQSYKSKFKYKEKPIYLSRRK